MIHRACFGSVERFLGILIEHYAGAFPLWMSPIQAIVIPVSDKFLTYADEVYLKLSAAGLRTEINRKDDRLGYKIREASLQKIPYALVVGEKEVESSTINVRTREGGELGAMSLDAFLAQLPEWRK
jgi:threonyl-tRNA synthetase